MRLERTAAAMAAGALPIGSVATIPLWTGRAVRPTSAAAIAEEEEEEAVMAAATGVAAAIDACGKAAAFERPQEQSFRLILACIEDQFGIT
jgi:hypothetical protein